MRRLNFKRNCMELSICQPVSSWGVLHSHHRWKQEVMTRVDRHGLGVVYIDAIWRFVPTSSSREWILVLALLPNPSTFLFILISRTVFGGKWVRFVVSRWWDWSCPIFFFVCFLPAALVLCHPSIPTRQLIQFPSHQSTLCRPVTSLDKSEGKVFLLGCARTKKHSPVSHPPCL